jgi:hypothetical protein
MLRELGRTDTGRASPTETRLEVDDYNDLTYSTLSVTRNDSDSQTLRRHHDSDLISRDAAFRDCTDFSTSAGPRSHRILGIPNLYITQGLSHIERILRYSHLDDITEQLIWASVEQLKLEIGCNRPTLSLPYAKFSKLATNSWIRLTWQFMDAYQIRIEDTSPDFLMSRANNQPLIPLFH